MLYKQNKLLSLKSSVFCLKDRIFFLINCEILSNQNWASESKISSNITSADKFLGMNEQNAEFSKCLIAMQGKLMLLFNC